MVQRSHQAALMAGTAPAPCGERGDRWCSRKHLELPLAPAPPTRLALGVNHQHSQSSQPALACSQNQGLSPHSPDPAQARCQPGERDPATITTTANGLTSTHSMPKQAWSQHRPTDQHRHYPWESLHWAPCCKCLVLSASKLVNIKLTIKSYCSAAI